MTLTAGGSLSDKVNFIWSVADLLRGDFRQSEYGRVILPFVVVRRLDCVLTDTKRAVRTKASQMEGRIDDPERVLCAVAGEDFYNTSPPRLRRAHRRCGRGPGQPAGLHRRLLAGRPGRDRQLPLRRWSLIAKAISLHPHNLAQRAKVVVDHFRSHVAHQINGQAKAMVVTASRLHAVRYKQAIDAYLADQHITDVKTLVAFSGKVGDPTRPWPG